MIPSAATLDPRGDPTSGTTAAKLSPNLGALLGTWRRLGAPEPTSGTARNDSRINENLAPLPVRSFPGIGPVAEGKLHAAGYQTLGAVAEASVADLQKIFGAWAASISRGVQGLGSGDLGRERPAFAEHDPEATAQRGQPERGARLPGREHT